MRLGQKGEEFATGFLDSKGYSILERNYRTKIGEIDIIAAKHETLVFCEVKTRQGNRFGLPVEAVTPKKQATIRTVAEIYLSSLKSFQKYDEVRFDVIAITVADGSFNINHMINAF
jgi:putative endonuclease